MRIASFVKKEISPTSLNKLASRSKYVLHECKQLHLHKLYLEWYINLQQQNQQINLTNDKQLDATSQDIQFTARHNIFIFTLEIQRNLMEIAKRIRQQCSLPQETQYTTQNSSRASIKDKTSQTNPQNKRQEIALYFQHFILLIEQILSENEAQNLSLEYYQQIIEYFAGVTQELASKIYSDRSPKEQKLSPDSNQLFKIIKLCLETILEKNNSLITFRTFSQKLLHTVAEVLYTFDLCSSST